MPPAEWLELVDVDALRAWCANGGTVPAVLLGHVLSDEPTLCRSAIALMPPAQADVLLRATVPALRDEATFARAPTWAGAPVETGALARQRNEQLVQAVHKKFGNAVVTRVVARLVELALLVLELQEKAVRTNRPPRIQSIPLGTNEGLAAVETARGLLLHRAQLRDERVVDYQIVAPTNGTFTPKAHWRAALKASSPKMNCVFSAPRGWRCTRLTRASDSGSRWVMHEVAIAEGVLRR